MPIENAVGVAGSNDGKRPTMGLVPRPTRSRYLTDVITRIVASHPQSQIDDLLPWAFAAATADNVA